MTAPVQEETLMTSNDDSIVLTSHRLLHKNRYNTEEILLKNIVECKLYKKRYAMYLVITIVFAVLYFSKVIRYTNSNLEWNNAAAQNVLSILVSIISLIFYLSTHRKRLKVSDGIHKIEVPLEYVRLDSFKVFFTRLKCESYQRKKETL